jgi:hypothetical protein
MSASVKSSKRGPGQPKQGRDVRVQAMTSPAVAKALAKKAKRAGRTLAAEAHHALAAWVAPDPPAQ